MDKRKLEKGIQPSQQNPDAPSTQNNPSLNCRCPKCPESFPRRLRLIRHFNNNHPQTELHQCAECNFFVLTSEELISHQQLSHTEACHFCGKNLPQNSINNHTATAHGLPSRKCVVCGIYCATHKDLVIHMGEHEQKSGQRLLFSCHICEAVLFFLSAEEKKEHMMTVHPKEFQELCLDRQLPCNRCLQDGHRGSDCPNPRDNKAARKEWLNRHPERKAEINRKKLLWRKKKKKDKELERSKSKISLCAQEKKRMTTVHPKEFEEHCREPRIIERCNRCIQDGHRGSDCPNPRANRASQKEWLNRHPERKAEINRKKLLIRKKKKIEAEIERLKSKSKKISPTNNPNETPTKPQDN